MPDIEKRGEFEEQLTRGLSRIMASARSRLVTAVYREGFTLGQLANIPPDVLDEFRQELERLFKDRLDDIFVEAAQVYAGQLAYGVDEDELQQVASQWANLYAPTLAQQIVTSTHTRLRDIARRAPEAPINRRDFLAYILAALGLSRATMIAITEVTNAISRGEEAVNEKLRQDSVTVDPVWFTQLDERVCPVCAPRHGKLEGNGWTMRPPAHPRCRCYVGYRLTKDGQVTILYDDNAVVRELQRARR